MIDRPKHISFQLNPERGLYEINHKCSWHCYGHSTQSLVIDFAFYGTREQARGFAYGLVFRFNAESEFWYHSEYVSLEEYSRHVVDFNSMNSSARVIWQDMQWMFSSSLPQEFLSGFSKGIEFDLVEINPEIDFTANTERRFDILKPYANEYECSECGSSYIQCNCENYSEMLCDHSVILKDIQKQYPCDVIYKTRANPNYKKLFR